MSSPLLFDIHFPQGPLALWVQAIWSAQVPIDRQAVTRRLVADAGSGILFNLGVLIRVDNEVWHDPVVFQSTNKQAHFIHLPAGADLVGVRFQPGMGRLFQTELAKQEDNAGSLLASEFIQSLLAQLKDCLDIEERIGLLDKAFNQRVSSMTDTCDFVMKAVELLQQSSRVDLLDVLPISQRQIERQFQRRLSMSPKYFQRLRRVRAVLLALKEEQSHFRLAELAIEYGFSDQAHMTRECQLIAGVTPKRYLKNKGLH
ncbi:AraC family transcriptional regulator [Marinomonas sp. M1K-6]|uniref:AraC family transcriptional regulator n=1 Tax=Marinomonas profundi TaxID=2726122 RepID=A0A847QUN1_9GAMM|nr:helix-turn-helix domain-containing protein [Marinomonas profundi]NLQ16178.1 AraC family transcriptional regulator [Marinomonas profundi]UDV03239.1 AraC family transcriptional regulator [Marinomonas profundi]